MIFINDPNEVDSDLLSRITICLDDQILTETLEALDLQKETKFVCLDTALDDSQKVNLAIGCLLKAI